MHKKMRTEKKIATPTRKRKSASTEPAIVEALSGNSGNVISGIIGSSAPDGTSRA
jgi:hypothetical protein